MSDILKRRGLVSAPYEILWYSMADNGLLFFHLLKAKDYDKGAFIMQ